MPGERTPLIGNGDDPGCVGQAHSYTDEVSPVSVPEPDEDPPPYSKVASDGGGVPMVTCRVCQAMIDITGKTEQYVVKCNKCNEATPIKSAPPGKKYVRCPCNCLLICRAGSPRIACPRPNCTRIINLQPSSTPGPTIPTMPGMCRVKCTYCAETFIFNTLNNALARCPHCRHVSSVGPDYARWKAAMFFALGVGFFFGSVIMIVTTSGFTKQYPGIYVAYVAGFVVSAALLIRVYYFCSMKVSAVEGPL